MAPVFVDTSIWYAAADSSDAHSQVARTILAERAGALVTTDVVLAELWNLVNGRAGHRAAHNVVAAASAAARVECITGADLQVAAEAAAAFPDQAFSLTDRTSWALMERSSIADALAFDADFRVYRYGPGRRRAFTVLP